MKQLYELEAEVCGVSVETGEISMNGRSGAEHHIEAQVVATALAVMAESAWHTRFHCYSVTFKLVVFES